jgi:hypothetical protein
MQLTIRVRIVFINPPNVKRYGASAFRNRKRRAIHDTFGNAYNLKIDGNYDNKLANSYTHDTGASPLTLNIGVIAWSLGKDAAQGTDFNASDDVISWQ